MNKYIDTHAHLTFPDYEKDLDEVLDRSWAAGLEHIITIGSGEGGNGNAKAISLAQREARIFATVGVHPHDAKVFDDGMYDQLKGFAKDPKVVAIGEIGLDFHYEHSPREDQISAFKRQIELAHEADKPIAVHDREAHEDVLAILNEVGLPKKGVLFHCFSGDVELANKVIDMGAMISIPGIITYKNAKTLAEVVSNVAMEKMLIETDCPFLAPTPHRGKRNEPAFVVEVAKRIAELKGLMEKDVARITTLNAKRFFGLPGASLEPSIAYRIRNSLYLNITNRCNLSCTFCPKRDDSFDVKGHFLKLDREPNVEEIFQAVGNPEKYDEVVFCGFGEPTLRLEILKQIAMGMKSAGAKGVRLNTDGLANLVYGRDVAVELKGIVDVVSISLNAQDAKTYNRICPSKFDESAFGAVLDFARSAKNNIPKVIVSVVNLPEVDIEACMRLASQLGVEFRVREYMNVG